MSGGKKSVLVLGGSGFVGVNLVPALLREGYEVALLNRGNVQMTGVRQLVANREVPDDLQRAAATAGRFDAVIDTSSLKRSHSEAAWAVFASATRHWIHLGSAAVYQGGEIGYSSEEDPIGGTAVWGPYGVEKSEADDFLIERSRTVPVTIFRPPYLYGPSNSLDRESFVWARALRNRPVIVPGHGRTQIQFLHIEDLVSAMILAIEHVPHEAAVYNIAGDERPTLVEWVAIAAGAAGCADPSILAGENVPDYRPRQYFPFLDSPLGVKTNRIKEVLGWRPRYSLAEGLRQTFAVQDAESLKTKVLNSQIEDEILRRLSTRT